MSLATPISAKSRKLARRRFDTKDLISVERGTLVGDFMRCYWIPALMSSELPEPGGPPLRARLLGENLIAYRSHDGIVGLLDHACPHRGASFFFGRNEPGGLRCIYHGWQFKPDGSCVDMPNEPLGATHCKRLKATAYQTRERNGIVWAWLGKGTAPVELPALEANMLGESDSEVVFVQRECNWLQALEGDIDTSHLGFLHLGALSLEDAEPGTFSEFVLRDRAPRYKVTDTEYGTVYGAHRPGQPGKRYWRIAHYLFPFYTMPPVGLLGDSVLVRAWVPMDNEHTMFVMCRPKSAEGVPSDVGPFLPNTSDWWGRWRLAANQHNDYLIDRDQQRTISYSGMQGNYLQDQAITESMGPIVNHDREHLGSADAMIVSTRRRILDVATRLRKSGVLPPGVEDPSIYAVRAGGIMLGLQDDWLQATAAARQVRPRRRSIVDERLLGNVLANPRAAKPTLELRVELGAWHGKDTVRAVTAQILPQLMKGTFRGKILYVLATSEQVRRAARSMPKAIQNSGVGAEDIHFEGRRTWRALHYPDGADRPIVVQHRLTSA